MISVSDILKLLDKIPTWKKLTDLPNRINQLEEKIKSLEEKISPNGKYCTKCHSKNFRFISSKPGEIPGVKFHLYKCDECNYEEEFMTVDRP